MRCLVNWFRRKNQTFNVDGDLGIGHGHEGRNRDVYYRRLAGLGKRKRDVC
jgi:hypothetical protein